VVLPPGLGAHCAAPLDHVVNVPGAQAGGGGTQPPMPFATSPAGQFAVEPPGEGMQTGVPFTAVDCCPAGQLEVVTALADGEAQVATTAITRVIAMSTNVRITACLSLTQH